MATESLFNSQLSGRTHLGFGPGAVGSVSSRKYGDLGRLEPIDLRSTLNYRWGVYSGANPEPLAFGQVSYRHLERALMELQKLRRQHQELLAAVSLDPVAQRLLSILDRETSIRWEDLPDRVESNWGESSRAAALLAGANLCEASATRIRLNEYGDRMMAESSLVGQTHAEVAG